MGNHLMLNKKDKCRDIEKCTNSNCSISIKKKKSRREIDVSNLK